MSQKPRRNPNLAGRLFEECDAQIRDELSKAGIDIVQHQYLVPYSEVETHLTGSLGGAVIDLENPNVDPPKQGFTFKRAWYYWVVNGRVPLAVAKELYADPVGRTAVRVDGNCGCPEPTGDVTMYHIDTQEGLELFALTVKAHGLTTHVVKPRTLPSVMGAWDALMTALERAHINTKEWSPEGKALMLAIIEYGDTQVRAVLHEAEKHAQKARSNRYAWSGVSDTPGKE